MKTNEDIVEEVLDKYEILQRIGRGRFGVVYKALDKSGNFPVAVKRVYDVFKSKSDAERFYREIKFLEVLGRHPNIIKLHNVLRSEKDDDLYLVLDYMEANLFNVIRAKILNDQHIKLITYQLLKAVKYMHSMDVVNRNLKPSQVLVNSDCKVKIDDFSLAKPLNCIDDFNLITDYVATRWYRAPELLLGSLNVGKPADLWSVGCILGEMVNGKTVFPGTCTLNQLNLIVALSGFPTKDDIADIQGTLSGLLESVKKNTPRTFNEFFLEANYDLIDLLSKLLTFNPKKRIGVDEALSHHYFAEFRIPEEEVNGEGGCLDLEISEEMKYKILEYKEEYMNKTISRLPTGMGSK